VTGDNAKAIHLWEPVEGGKWAVDKSAPFQGHESSVEAGAYTRPLCSST